MAAGTIVLAIIAVLGYCATIDNLNRSQRAWIAPVGAEIAGPVEVGRALRVNILYENVGREPALDVTPGQPRWRTLKIFPNVHGEAWLSNLPIVQNNTCAGIAPESGRETVYPSNSKGPLKELIYVFNAEPWPSVTENFINRNETFLIFGCFVYKTIDEIHSSLFCLYVQPTPDENPEDWTFRFCPSGNHAD